MIILCSIYQILCNFRRMPRKSLVGNWFMAMCSVHQGKEWCWLYLMGMVYRYVVWL